MGRFAPEEKTRRLGLGDGEIDSRAARPSERVASHGASEDLPQPVRLGWRCRPAAPATGAHRSGHSCNARIARHPALTPRGVDMTVG
jgi:hypothetical protein